MSKSIDNHEGVQEWILWPTDTDDFVKYDVFLKSGWCWGAGRNEGGRTGFFKTVKEFVEAQPITVVEAKKRGVEVGV